jgi:hypothetical protein
MIKRLLDSALRARQYWSQNREIVLRVLTHNIMILRWRVFYRANSSPFQGSFPKPIETTPANTAMNTPINT